MECVAFDFDVGHLGVANLASFGIVVLIHTTVDFQAFRSTSGSNKADHDLVAFQRNASPVASDVTEQTMFDFVPFARARRVAIFIPVSLAKRCKAQRRRCVLSGWYSKELGEEVGFPSCHWAAHGDAFLVIDLLQQAHCKAFEPRKIAGQCSIADTVFIFPKRHVKTPIKPVFNRPVPPNAS